MDKERILFLLDRHAEGIASQEEENELDQWLETFSNSNSTFRFDESEREQLTETMLRQLHEETAAIKVLPLGNKRKSSLWKWMAAAAAVGFFIALAGYYLLQNRQNLLSDIAHKELQDVAPGGNHAILTLANGRQILLDSASNGQLASQAGVKVIKLDSGMLYLAGTGNQKGLMQYNTLTTPRGGQYKLILPDHTQVWLNAESKIRFPIMFAAEKREVEMEGEAYFEVAKAYTTVSGSNSGKLKPFLVHSGNQEVEVLGTHFNIDAYPDEKSIKTTLFEGKVRVNNTTGKNVLLNPGQQAVNSTGNLKITVPEDLDAVVAWKNGLISFEGSDVGTLLQQIGRWYDVEIEYEKGVPEGTLTGDISRYTSLSNVAKILDMNGIRCTIKGRKLIIK